MARRKSLAWWEEGRPGPFAAWKCSCCARLSTHAEYAGRDGGAICSECASLSCYVLDSCARTGAAVS